MYIYIVCAYTDIPNFDLCDELFKNLSEKKPLHVYGSSHLGPASQGSQSGDPPIMFGCNTLPSTPRFPHSLYLGEGSYLT